MLVFNITNFILIVISTIIAIYISLAIKNKPLKILSIFVLSGFFFYSGVGLFIYQIENDTSFTIQYCLCAITFSITLFLCQKQNKTHILKKRNIDESYIKANNYLFTKIFSFVYVLTFIFPLIYPINRIADIFNPLALIEKYSSVHSYTVVNLKSDNTYFIVTNFVRTLCMPYFYIYLYSIREKHMKVIIIYILLSYLNALNLYYISRNEIIVLIAFIFIYLYLEKILSPKLLILLFFVSVPSLIIMLNVLKYVRSSQSYNTNFIISLGNVFLSETNFVLNYNRASYLSKDISLLKYYTYVLTCFIPSFIRSKIGIYPINLQEIHSTTMLKLDYGKNNFYIILTSVLGEGIMVFNKYFSWIYMIFFAIILNWYIERINRNESMLFLLCYFLLDVLRNMRGGSQFIFSSWGSSFVPLLIISYLFRQIIVKKYKKE